MRLSALVLLASASLLLAGCPFVGGDDDPERTPTAVPSPPPTQAAPTPSPTPDPFDNPPTFQIAAREWLQAILGVSYYSPPCPEKLKQAGVGCAQGDATGDGFLELAYLVPVKRIGAASLNSAAVFIRDGFSQKLDEFALDLTADASILGLAFFQLEDRTGDGRPDLSYIENVCGVSGCASRAVILSWDGTAWRDVGPGETVNNLDSLKWEGTGAASKLVIHGGKLPADAPAESGPSRAATTAYTLTLGRYTTSKVTKDPPVYLYHAIEDADLAFEHDIAASEMLYRKALQDTALRDWKLRVLDADRSPALLGYALFRLVLVDAAQSKDPTAAIDKVIRESKEPLFVLLAEEFRKGFQERSGLVGGCAAVNLYLRTPPVGAVDPAAYVQQLFNYGYANPPGSKWLAKLCPF